MPDGAFWLSASGKSSRARGETCCQYWQRNSATLTIHTLPSVCWSVEAVRNFCWASGADWGMPLCLTDERTYKWNQRQVFNYFKTIHLNLDRDLLVPPNTSQHCKLGKRRTKNPESERIITKLNRLSLLWDTNSVFKWSMMWKQMELILCNC